MFSKHVFLKSTLLVLLSSFQIAEASPLPNGQILRDNTYFGMPSHMLGMNKRDRDKRKATLIRDINILEHQHKELCHIYNMFEKKSLIDKIKKNEARLQIINAKIGHLMSLDQQDNRDSRDNDRISQYRNTANKITDEIIFQYFTLYSFNSPVARKMKMTLNMLNAAKKELIKINE